MNPYILFLAAFALWYVPGALALYKMEYSFKNLQLVRIKETYFEIGVNMIVKNVSSVALNVKTVDMWVYIDGQLITQMFVGDTYIQPKSSQTVGALFKVEKSKVTPALWSSIVNKQFVDSTITFKGIARTNGRPYPFTFDMPMKDLIEYTLS